MYPRAEVQLCIVHLVRASLNYVPWKRRKQVAADLQLIYRAATAAEAERMPNPEIGELARSLLPKLLLHHLAHNFPVDANALFAEPGHGGFHDRTHVLG